MQLTKKEIKIIKLLLSSSNYISSYEIANTIGLKRSLVRSEMLSVKQTLSNMGYELVSKTAKGYMIESHSFESMKNLERIIEEAECQRESLFPNTQGERQIYIFNRLIDSNDYLKIDDLAEELLTSRSTITNDLKDARRRLEKYRLILKQRPNYGLYISGDELSKRRIQCDFMFTNLRQSKLFYDFLDTFRIEPNSLEYKIIDIIIHYHLNLSDIALCDLLICILVSLKRIRAGFTLTSSPDISNIKNRREFEIAQMISNLIIEEGYEFNEHELNRLGIWLTCKQEFLAYPTYGRDIKELTKMVIDTIYERTLIDLNNQNIIQSLSERIQTSIIRMQYNESIRTPLYNVLKSIYPLGQELATITQEIFKKQLHKNLSLSELSFYTLFYNNAIEDQKRIKKEVLLLTGLGRNIECACINTLNEHFDHQINLTSVSQYYLLSNKDLSQYDFIISTLPIHKELDIPCINISQIINQDDLNKIDNHLSYYYNRPKLETVFNPNLYEVHVPFKTTKEIINYAHVVLKKQFKTLKKKSTEDIFNLGQISVNHYDGLALIKLNKPIINVDFILVLCLEECLDWDSHSNKVLVILSTNDINNHLYNTLNARFVELSQHKKTIKALEKHLTYVEFLKFLIKDN